MKYAIGVTVIGVGAVLIFSGWKDVPIWDTFLSVIRAQTPGTVTAVAPVTPVMSPPGRPGTAVGTAGNTPNGAPVLTGRNSSGSF